MEPHYVGTPTGIGRGRPVEPHELRRPHTYAECIAREPPNTNGMLPNSQWTDQIQAQPPSFFASPSGDHPRPYEDPATVEKSTKFKLSPFAKEFVPRNFIPASEEIEQPVLEDSLPVLKLRVFLDEITMSPGKFERKIQPLIHTLNTSVDDDDTMSAVVNVIFDESIKQSNLRYSGARLCKSLCSGIDPSSNHASFKDVLLKRCEQEFKLQKNLAQADDGGTRLRGFALFMAELYSQLDVNPQKIPVLGDSLPNLIKTLLSFSTPENLKCACQILKLVGAFLEDNERSNGNATPEMDSIIFSLNNLANDQQYTRNAREMMSIVIKLRENDWGRSSSHTENTNYDAPPPNSTDEPVMYGPDGKPMTADELMFLQSQYASNYPVDSDEYDLYDDNPGEEMPDEISEAYEAFLRENGLRH